MNILTLLAALLLAGFYFNQYVLDKPKPYLAVVGLSLLTLGMMVDHLSAIYVITTAISAVCAAWGALKPP